MSLFAGFVNYNYWERNNTLSVYEFTTGSLSYLFLTGCFVGQGTILEAIAWYDVPLATITNIVAIYIVNSY